MTECYFEKLNHHIIHIDTNEAEIRVLWDKYLEKCHEKKEEPDFTMWCVFLAKNGIRFYCHDTSFILQKDVIKV
jgi:hypothetical protein